MTEVTQRPDPTQRTIEMLHREIETVQERAELLLKGVEDNTREQFRSNDSLRALTESQRVEQKKDTKDAVDAALTAQKEAVKEQTTASERAIAKSETATSKQLDQLTATFTASIQGVTDLLNDTKERVGKIEAIKQGGKDFVATILAVGAVVISLSGVIILVIRT